MREVPASIAKSSIAEAESTQTSLLSSAASQLTSSPEKKLPSMMNENFSPSEQILTREGTAPAEEAATGVADLASATQVEGTSSTEKTAENESAANAEPACADERRQDNDVRGQDEGDLNKNENSALDFVATSLCKVDDSDTGASNVLAGQPNDEKTGAGAIVDEQSGREQVEKEDAADRGPWQQQDELSRSAELSASHAHSYEEDENEEAPQFPDPEGARSTFRGTMRSTFRGTRGSEKNRSDHGKESSGKLISAAPKAFGRISPTRGSRSHQGQGSGGAASTVTGASTSHVPVGVDASPLAPQRAVSPAASSVAGHSVASSRKPRLDTGAGNRWVNTKKALYQNSPACKRTQNVDTDSLKEFAGPELSSLHENSTVFEDHLRPAVGGGGNHQLQRGCENGKNKFPQLLR
ncbi:unnamed protein product [Amoebophrya sp. A25]|nr:unnamed protein product [Amoebophrya sp. A25]|eukprot:GSA25T00005275001.1